MTKQLIAADYLVGGLEYVKKYGWTQCAMVRFKNPPSHAADTALPNQLTEPMDVYQFCAVGAILAFSAANSDDDYKIDTIDQGADAIIRVVNPELERAFMVLDSITGSAYGWCDGDDTCGHSASHAIDSVIGFNDDKEHNVYDVMHLYENAIRRLRQEDADAALHRVPVGV